MDARARKSRPPAPSPRATTHEAKRRLRRRRARCRAIACIQQRWASRTSDYADHSHPVPRRDRGHDWIGRIGDRCYGADGTGAASGSGPGWRFNAPNRDAAVTGRVGESERVHRDEGAHLPEMLGQGGSRMSSARRTGSVRSRARPPTVAPRPPAPEPGGTSTTRAHARPAGGSLGRRRLSGAIDFGMPTPLSVGTRGPGTTNQRVCCKKKKKSAG